MGKSSNFKRSEQKINNTFDENPQENLNSALKEIKEKYFENVPENIQILDSFIFFLVMVAIIQVIYFIIVQKTYPLDSFIGGVFSSLGTALLVSVLRIQLTQTSFFNNVSQQTAFTDFMICCTVFFIGCASLLV
ncbi:DAD1/Ost2 like dolichyl diphospho oligosaccharide protein glycosyltransferase [Cryptosporidium ryanae]|uniref:DAD1/Ost2 like dolichyl diphospho oligosaccharide protein glycosyltransferase n=1 Tax=Cryptosporidium ryanae TaxID=515981 RepID=UPI00351A8066|nr:DAD1/Ost2 like dolichyl diphospho oligosaccharide protein glycosyltransferase [Cryptosporidium ryanae]